MSLTARRRSRPIGTGSLALFSALALVATLVIPATVTASPTKSYSATWIASSNPVANPPNTITLPGGITSAVLRITNHADPQSIGSANLTVPSSYTLIGGSLSPAVGSATKVGNTLQLRNLGLAPSASVDVTINVRTPCAGGAAVAWALVVKQANNFSGPPGNDFSHLPGTVVPSTAVAASACLLRFANQPATTETGALIRDGHDSSGDPITVEIYDPGTGLVVDSDAAVTLTLDRNPAGGALSGGAVSAVDGVATFPALSIGTPGPYTLKASSPAASNTPISDQFMVSDVVTECSGSGCTFTQQGGPNSYTTTPRQGTAGADYATSLNLPGLLISCDFAPFDYPDARQPNAVWYVYDDGQTGSAKTNIIVIDKSVVQVTPENGSSKYRVCYTSPVPFEDRTGGTAQPDPWPNGPSAYFGETWYTGLLPDCGKKAVAPCVVSWTGSGSGNRVGTFLTPPGDPGFR